VTGTWKITISTSSIKESVIQVACFEVREYVLPKFEVNTFSSSYILRDATRNMTVAVASRYSYGKPVKGNVCLELTTVHIESFYYFYKPKMQTFCRQTNGLTDFNVDIRSLITSGYWPRYRFSYYGPIAIQVNVSVTEQGTRVIANSSETVPIVEREYILRFKPGTAGFYKPGLPFSAQIVAATADQRAAVDFLIVSVSVYDGWVHLYSFDDIVVNGTLEFNVFYQSNRFQSYLRIQAVIDGKSARVSHVAHPRAAAGQHYMSLTPNVTTLKPGIPSTVFIMTTRKVNIEAFGLVVSRGQILKSWAFKLKTIPSAVYTGVHESTMSLTPLCSWAPRCQLVVYYIEEEKFVVAGNISLNLEPCFQHKVEMTFSRNESRPGEKVQLLVQSFPHSHVSLTGVDKSAYLLDSACSSQITAAQVLAEFLKYEPGSQDLVEDSSDLLSDSDIELDQRDWWRSWWDATDTPYYLKFAGITIISDYAFTQKVKRLRRGLDSLGASGGFDIDGDSEGDDVIDQFASVKRVRSYFPEAWLWVDKQTDENGKLSLNVTVPDTITTWITDAFAMSNTAAFGMTHVPSRLVAFKPFFISLSLPYSVVRREEVEITATVFNYYYENLEVIIICADYAE
jgi:CD109 antigen